MHDGLEFHFGAAEVGIESECLDDASDRVNVVMCSPCVWRRMRQTEMSTSFGMPLGPKSAMTAWHPNGVGRSFFTYSWSPSGTKPLRFTYKMLAFAVLKLCLRLEDAATLKRCDLEALKERGPCALGNCVPKRSVSSCDLRFVKLRFRATTRGRVAIREIA